MSSSLICSQAAICAPFTLYAGPLTFPHLLAWLLTGLEA